MNKNLALQSADIPKRSHSMIKGMLPGIMFGLIYGMITMFPEWLFYTSGNSAPSIGIFLNLPAVTIILNIIALPGIFGPFYDHYLMLSLVLITDAILCGLLSSIVRLYFKWKDRCIAFLLLFGLFYFFIPLLLVIL